ncbi:MAG: DJ-1 family glyoxalase III [Chloroflexota bacterium]|nr:DJ-1 family glyoxalase III [Chloroflexota bacterium]
MKAVVPLAEGFEEIEFNSIVDVLRRAGIEVVTASLKEGLIEGSHGIKVMPDTSIDNINPEQFDVIVIPGGDPGFVNLGKDRRVLKLVRELDKAGKYVTAICGGPVVLSLAGIIKGRRVTSHPGARGLLTDAQYVEERVVVDGRLITSQGPGTAMEFAMKLVEILMGKDKVQELNSGLLARL